MCVYIEIGTKFQ